MVLLLIACLFHTQTSKAITIARTGNDTSICANTLQVIGNLPLEGSERATWEFISGNFNILNPQNSSTTLTFNQSGIHLVRWIILDTLTGETSSDTLQVSYVINPSSNAGIDRNVCTSNATLAAIAPSIGTGRWFRIAGTANISNPLSRNSAVSSLQVGINTFEWRVINGICVARDTVQLTYINTSAGSNQFICSDSTHLQATNAPTGGTGTWNIISGSGDFDDFNDPRTKVRNLSSGLNVFQWIVVAGCPTTSLVQITNNQPSKAQAGSDRARCADTVVLNANTPLVGTGTWRQIVGSGVIENTASTFTKVSTLSTGSNHFEWSIRNGICSSIDTVSISNLNPSRANAGNNLNICNDTASLTGNLPLQGTGRWFAGNGQKFSDSSAFNSKTYQLQLGNNLLIWEITHNTCTPSKDTVIINKNPTIQADAGINRKICTDTVYLKANESSTGSGNWRLLQGSANIVQPTQFNTLLTNIQDGNLAFEWTYTVSGCSPSKDTVWIEKKSTSTPVTLNNQTICTDSLQLFASNPLVGIGTWSITSGTGILADSLNPNTWVKSIGVGILLLRWRIQNDFCSSEKIVQINNQMTSPAIAGQNKVICSATDSLKAGTVVHGIGNWEKLSGPGVIQNVNQQKTLVTQLSPGKNNFIWTVRNSGCVSNDTISITNDMPSVALSQSDTIVCSSSAMINALPPLYGIGNWTRIAGSGSISNAQAAKSVLSNLSKGLNTWLWTISSTFCGNSSDTLNIYNYSTTTSLAGSDICLVSNGSSTIQLNANKADSTRKEVAFWTNISPNSIFFSPGVNSTNPTVSGLQSGFHRFIWNIFDETFSCSNRDTLVVSIVPAANPIADPCIKIPSASTQTIQATLISNNSLKSNLGERGKWTYVNTLLNQNPPLPTIDSINGQITQMRRGVHRFRYIIFNLNHPSCTSSTDILTTVLTKADAGAAQCVKLNSTTVVANLNNPINPLVGGKGLWTSKGTANIVGYPTGNITGLKTGTNTFYLTNSNTQSTCSDIDSVTITYLTNPFAGNDTFLINSSTLKLQANRFSNSSEEIGSWSVASGSSQSISFDSIQSPTSIVRGLQIGNNTLIWKNTNLVSNCSLSDTISLFNLTSANAGPNVTFVNANPNVPLVSNITALQGPNSSRGESSVWTLVSSNAAEMPILSNANNSATLTLSNLRRGVHRFRYTIFGGPNNQYRNQSEMQVTVLTKAIAGNNLCLTETKNLVLGNQGSINIRPASGEVYRWTTKTPGVNISPLPPDSIPISAIQNLPLGKTLFYLTIENTLSNAKSIDSIWVINMNKAQLGSDTFTCSNAIILQPKIIPDTTLGESSQWEVLKGINGKTTGYAALNTPLDTGTNIIKFQIQHLTCINSDTIRITNKTVNNVSASADSNTCFTTNTITGNNPKTEFRSAKGKWSIVSQPSNNFAQIKSDTNHVSQVINMTKAGNYTFRWSITNGNCPAVFKDVTIIRNSIIPANGGPSVTICDSFYTMKALAPQAPGTGTWSLKQGGGTFTDIQNPRMLITDLSADTNVFDWKVVNGACEGVQQVIIVRKLKPTKANISVASIAICSADSVQLIGNTPSIGISEWKNQNPLITITNPSSSQTYVKNLPFGTSIFEYQIDNGIECPVYTDTILIRNDQRVDSVSAGINEDICGNSINLNGNLPFIGMGKWTLSSSVTGVTIADSSNHQSSVLFSNEGTYSFKWKIQNGMCSDSAQSVKTIRFSPIKPKAPSDTIVCDTISLPISVASPSFGKLKWKTLSGNHVYSNDSSSNSNLQLKTHGLHVLELNTINDYCIAKDTFSIESSKFPSMAKAAKDTTICADQIFLDVERPTFGQGRWKIETGISMDSISPFRFNAKNLKQGINVLIWEVSTSNCPKNIDSVLIASISIAEPNAGISKITCSDSTQMTAINPLKGSGEWQWIKGSGEIAEPSNPNTNVYNLGNGHNILAWKVSLDLCSPATDTVSIFNNTPKGLIPFENLNVYDSEVELKTQAPLNGFGSWQILTGKGTIQDANLPNTKAIDLSEGENIARWTISNSGCNSIYQDLRINVNRFFIPEGFSPNGDSKNQTFFIRGLQDHPNTQLEVYNRWGNLVYNSTNYQNTWNGKNLQGEDLPDDTYYYSLQLKNGKNHKGFVIIKR